MKKYRMILFIVLIICLMVIVPITFSGCQVVNSGFMKEKASSLLSKIKEIDFSKILKIFKK